MVVALCASHAGSAIPPTERFQQAKPHLVAIGPCLLKLPRMVEITIKATNDRLILLFLRAFW
jgi:hypothetical protein